MNQSDAKPRPNTAPRPRIWVEGQQRPRFDLPAYGRVTATMAKRALAPAIGDAVQRLGPLGHAVATGQRRLTPRRFAAQDARVGRAILGLAALFRGAHDLLVPVQPDLTLAYPDIIRPARPAPRAQPVAPPPARDEPTLQAIRSAMFFGQPDPAAPPPTSNAPASDTPVTDTPASPASPVLWTLACRSLLVVLMAFALPMAALRAGWFHLQGGDLTDWS